MEIDPRLLVAVGDVFLNLSAGWFGAALFISETFPRTPEKNFLYIIQNILYGCVALAMGYQLRIMGV